MKTLIITLLCVIQICVFSQNEEQEKLRQQILSKTNTKELENLRIEFDNKFKTNKEEVIKWTNRKGYPAKIVSSDG